MIPDPIIGKHYSLENKRIPVSRTFRGYVCIRDIGRMSGKLIFCTYQTDNNWFFWEDYNYEYIGDLA